jgi:hypothetical protein
MLWPTLALSGKTKRNMAIDTVLSRIFPMISFLHLMAYHPVLITLTDRRIVHNCVFNESKAKPF